MPLEDEKMSEHRLKRLDSVEEIPERMTEEEAAEFYGNYDLADVWDDLEPVEEPFVPSSRLRESMLSLRLERRYMDALKTLAQKRGLSPYALVRLWVMEKVKEEAPELIG